MHAPEQVGAVAEARRLGGLRRRREVATGNEYDLLAIRAPADVMRLLDIAASDTLVLENSPARTRALAYIANAAIRAITVTQFDERLSALERLGFESHGAG